MGGGCLRFAADSERLGLNCSRRACRGLNSGSDYTGRRSELHAATLVPVL